MAGQRLVFVGTYSEPILFGTGQIVKGRGRGIYAYRFDPSSGELTDLAVTEGVRNASYLAFDPARKFLYCVNEFKEFEGKASGAVSAFRIEGDSGRLTFLNMKASHGTDPCHLMVDRSGRNLLVANFASGSVCVLPIDRDGALREASDVIQHSGSSIDPKRQAGPHAHAVEIDAANRYAFVPELGADKVMIYELDAEEGKLTPNRNQPFVSIAPGAGPRQLVMHPNGRFAYLINELNSTMTAYTYDPGRGSLSETQTISTLPSGFSGHSSCAEVQINPSGMFLYGSNRGHDSISIFSIDQVTGILSVVGHESTRGKIPRNFDIDRSGEFLAAANQDFDSIVMFRIDEATGKLGPTVHVASAGTPICVRFL